MKMHLKISSFGRGGGGGGGGGGGDILRRVKYWWADAKVNCVTITYIYIIHNNAYIKVVLW